MSDLVGARRAARRMLGLAFLPEGDAWKESALCAETDPELFFPEKGGSTVAAKRICAQCPVQAKCLQQALDERITHGVWGGVSAKDRLDRLRHFPIDGTGGAA